MAVTVLVGDLGERLVEDGDVVGGGVRAGVAAAHPGGEELAGVVAERQHRVVAEGLLERGCGLLFLAVSDHDRRVQVDHQRVHCAPGRRCGRECPAVCLGVLGPHQLPCPGPRRRHPREYAVVEAVQ